MGIEENKKRFEELMGKVERAGVDSLMAYIRKSDFYTAPASTRFHGSYKGGLLQHSLNVYDCLKRKKEKDPMWSAVLTQVPDETIIVVALLHDICKTNYYAVEMRNKKINGKWEQVPVYVVDDKIPYGHGEKSVMIIMQHMELACKEKYAIRWHMGPYSGQQDWGTLRVAMEKYPLCLALFEADMEATYILEKEVKLFE